LRKFAEGYGEQVIGFVLEPVLVFVQIRLGHFVEGVLNGIRWGLSDSDEAVGLDRKLVRFGIGVSANPRGVFSTAEGSYYRLSMTMYKDYTAWMSLIIEVLGWFWGTVSSDHATVSSEAGVPIHRKWGYQFILENVFIHRALPQGGVHHSSIEVLDGPLRHLTT
jgi:hypothetical protein